MSCFNWAKFVIENSKTNRFRLNREYFKVTFHRGIMLTLSQCKKNTHSCKSLLEVWTESLEIMRFWVKMDFGTVEKNIHINYIFRFTSFGMQTIFFCLPLYIWNEICKLQSHGKANHRRVDIHFLVHSFPSICVPS